MARVGAVALEEISGLKGDAKEQSGWIMENAHNIRSLAAKILEEKITPLLHGEISFNRTNINEKSIFIESWDVIEGRLMKRKL